MQVPHLSRYEFPDDLIASWQSQGIKSLLPIQVQAIRRHRLFDGGSFIVSAPTSSGKTFIGELAAVHNGLKGRKTVYLVPLKALAEEKYHTFRRLYEPYGIRIAVSTRDRKEFDKALDNGEYEIAIVVYEKFFQLLNSSEKFLNRIGLVVIDELQLLDDPSRGANLELIMTRLKMLNGRFQFIGLTAVLGNNREVNEWLDVDLLHYDRRPVELRMGYLWNGVYYYRTYNSQEPGEEVLLEDSPGEKEEIITAAVIQLARADEQSLIFLKDKQSTRKLAEKIALEINQPPAEEALQELNGLETTISNEQLGMVLGKGVAFHHADLTAEERALVEHHFRRNRIKVLVSTTTLAMGVNLPSRNVFIELEKWHTDPGARRPYRIPLAKADFENMGGRAGRFQIEDEFGRAIAIATRQIECDQFQNIYLDGQLENIKPNLWRDSMATTVLGIVALGGCKTVDDVSRFLRSTLTWHLHRKDGVEQSKLNEQLEQGIESCLQAGVLKELEAGNLVLTDFGAAVAKNGVRVETGALLRQWLEERGNSPITPTEAMLAAVLTPDGQDAYLNMSTTEFHRIGALYQHRIYEMLGDGLCELFRQLAEFRLDNYQTVKSFKVALLLTGYIGTMSNQDLEKEYHTFFGAIKRVSEHVSWVLNSAAEITKALSYPTAWEEALGDLALQVQFGLPAEGIFLGQLRIPRLGRERIRALVREGVSSVYDVLDTGEDFIGNFTTKPVAEQLFRRIRELKRGEMDDKSKNKRGRIARSVPDTSVNQRENRGTVIVGVNTGTIIVGNSDNGNTTDGEAASGVSNEVADLSALRGSKWRQKVESHVDHLEPRQMEELYEKVRGTHHNRLRPLLRDAKRCDAVGDFKIVLKDIEGTYENLRSEMKQRWMRLSCRHTGKIFSPFPRADDLLMRGRAGCNLSVIVC